MSGSDLREGSLFSGYDGLGMAVRAVTGASLAWVSDIDPGACKILAHHHPDVPNLGDITTVDWATVEPVDILTGGSPCQDLSSAGKRGGMTEGTRSNLWVSMRGAIASIRPPMVIWENVRGAYSAAANSEMEPCQGCVGDGSGVHLRALGRVLGDLSELGYDAQWHGLTAASVGAPHGRHRVYVVATNTNAFGRNGWTGKLGPGWWGQPENSRHIASHASGTERRGTQSDGLASTLEGTAEPRERDCANTVRWGQFEPAVRRWERLTRPAPAPTELSSRGGQRLSPRFVEWMQGLPDGYVTQVPGLSANEQLRALGNGVVPQQAEAALRFLFSVVSERAA